MSWLIVALSYTSLSAFCLAMKRHHRQVHGRDPSSPRRRSLRLAGTVLLAITLSLANFEWGFGGGLIHVMIALGAVGTALVPLMSYRPRAAMALAVALPAAALILHIV